jgi:DNA-binding response OmpR family regulator
MAKKILCIDDNPELLDLYELHLAGLGHEVLTASDGNEGLRKIKSLRPDLVILDVMMPGMSGYDLFQKLKLDKSIGQMTPIIVISARAGMHDFFPEWEIHAFLAKPIKSDELVRIVTRALGPVASPRTAAAPAPASPTTPGPLKKILIAGTEAFLMEKVKQHFEAEGHVVIICDEEKWAVETAVIETPNAILGEFWESLQKFDVLKIVKGLQAREATHKIPFAAFCRTGLSLEAAQYLKHIPLILYEDSHDLIAGIENCAPLGLKKKA